MATTRANRNRLALIGVVFVLIALPKPLTAGKPAEAVQVDSQKQFFIDDHVVDSMKNLQRELHQPQRDAKNPILVGDQPWEAWVVEAHGRPVVYDPVTRDWKLYYITWENTKEAAYGQRYLTCVATSKDGITWTKPNLGQFDWHGSRDNNILNVGQKHWMRRVNAFYDEHEPDPKQRFKMTFVDVIEGNKTAIVRAASADGLTWHRLGEPWVPSGFGHNLNVLGRDPRTQEYVLFPRFVVEGRVGVGRSTSKDFVSWTQPTATLIPEKDEKDQQFKGLAAFASEGAYFGSLWVFQGPKFIDKAESELAFSRDGVNWARPFRGQMFFPRGQPGEWDCEMVLPPAPVVRDDQLWFYYTGWNFPYGITGLVKVRKGWIENGQRKLRALGIAKLRLDGFVSLTAKDQEGVVTTKPFRLTGDRLSVNVEAGQGEVRVEVLDADHTPIPGFSGDAAGSRQRFDEIRWQPDWKGKRDLSALKDRLVRLRFHLKNAKLYAFQVVEATPRPQGEKGTGEGGGGKAAPVIDIGSRRELMVDDFLVDRFEGQAELRLHAPTPRELVFRFDKPWEGNTSSYVEVFQRDGRYQMFYRGWDYIMGEKLAQGHSAMICYAESKDGIHWQRPNLGLVPFKDSKENNIVDFPNKVGDYAITKNTSTISIDENPNCPADARYKGFVLGLKLPERLRGLIPVQSADGKVWKPMTDQMVITGDAFDSPNRLFWDPVRTEYRAYWRSIVNAPKKDGTGNGGRRDIKTATSNDLCHWTEGQLLKYPGAVEEQLYTNMIFPYYRAPHLLVGFPTRYLDRGWSDSMRALPDRAHREMRAKALARVGTAMTDTLFMTSRDGLTFQRFGEAFIRPGPERPGTWNYSQTHTSCPVVETRSPLPGAPNELSLYVTEDFWTGKSGSALRRHTLRIDGFASVHAKPRGGEFVTKPLRFAGNQLRLNFATSVAGSILVELQTAEGQPVPGFTLQNCSEVFGDSLDRTVSWKKGTDVSTLRGSPVRLRFVMKDADLFAFQFRE